MIRRHAVAAYFLLTFAISWGAALCVVAQPLLRGEAPTKFAGLMMFPAMLLGPCCAGVLLTRLLDGREGLRALLFRMLRWRVGGWAVTLLMPPTLILTVLWAMRGVVSRDFEPNFFAMGVLFGVPAGFLEEVGWTGYALPRMIRNGNPLKQSVLLGLLWGLWHVPVIDYLGTATPHGAYWLAYFLAFTAAMTAMRVVIAWVYVNTESVLLAQLLHVSSTGLLVVFSPVRAGAGEEALWYAGYAGLLWLVVLAAVWVGRNDDGGSVARFLFHGKQGRVGVVE